jgi:hypothetical protein
MPNLKTIVGVPYETGRVALDSAIVQDWLTALGDQVHEIPRAFVFNMDETDCSDWADRPREIRVVVPAQCPEANLAVPVDRSSKRASMAVCITADGSCMRPFVVVHRTRRSGDVSWLALGTIRVTMMTIRAAIFS